MGKLLFIVLALIATLLPTEALATHVISDMAHIDLNTNKVAKVLGEVTEGSALLFNAQVAATDRIKGPLLVLIDTPGGEVEAGERMIDTIKVEQSRGVKVVCLVVNHASSMGFNILTHCDVRLALPGSFMLMHKIAIGGVDCMSVRCSAIHLRELADELDEGDAPFAEANRKALHLTKYQYDQLADAQHVFYPNELLFRHYLHGIASIRP